MHDAIMVYLAYLGYTIDVVLEIKALLSRHLEDKKGIVLALGFVLDEKSLEILKTKTRTISILFC